MEDPTKLPTNHPRHQDDGSALVSPPPKPEPEEEAGPEDRESPPDPSAEEVPGPTPTDEAEASAAEEAGAMEGPSGPSSGPPPSDSPVVGRDVFPATDETPDEAPDTEDAAG